MVWLIKGGDYATFGQCYDMIPKVVRVMIQLCYVSLIH